MDSAWVLGICKSCCLQGRTVASRLMVAGAVLLPLLPSLLLFAPEHVEQGPEQVVQGDVDKPAALLLRIR